MLRKNSGGRILLVGSHYYYVPPVKVVPENEYDCCLALNSHENGYLDFPPLTITEVLERGVEINPFDKF